MPPKRAKSLATRATPTERVVLSDEEEGNSRG
ncbi:hypothetical protein EYZ11_011046 [Aspergillus tanneri]|uniref:Uncharacterized protein n=1 Tax=Aspergillus tanneri TaxID=1220188 RepID=A0A4S3J4E5_9EURO|nr:hypothetical protein EYZ11_011046 [Aspergillus tanneri]